MFKVFSPSYPLMVALTPLLFLLFVTCGAKKFHYCDNPPASCGSIGNISYPFGLLGDPKSCGDPNYLLVCENNNTVLYLESAKYYVQEINRNSHTIRVVDAGLQEQNCSSLPLVPVTFNNFSYSKIRRYQSVFLSNTVTFMNCENPVVSPLYVDTAPCVHGFNNTSSSTKKSYSYVLVDGNAKLSEIPDKCQVGLAAMVSRPIICINCSYLHIHEEMLYGFELSWSDIYCEQCKGRGYCIFDNDDYTKFKGCSSGSFQFFMALQWMTSGLIYFLMGHVLITCVCGTPCVAIFLIRKWRRRHLSVYDTVEDFLRSHNNLMPIMYTYSEIKKMTSGFKDKLGEGGYGSVYKGKLSSGRIVAVKILSKSKTNGQDFINEVATIGRIHHANVVQLIGFCAQRSHRALVYEFMSNGSLEKYIFSKNADDTALSCEKMYEISLGVARGIEYLHRGCDMQILHFDIKPHNILLDENFRAKVSDFGLAKLYPTQDSIVSLTAPRGTMGYMAPELLYKNIGGVSYKADVYSFGMLLMEMASRRKNLNAFTERLSQIYFPSWIYDQLSEGKDANIEYPTEEEREITKKMIIAALWSIQLKPSDRPSMNKVVEMLEGDVESLQMPPKPFLCPQEMNHQEEETEVKKKTAAALLDEDIDSDT